MTDFSSDALSTYLSGTLGDGGVTVDDVVAHTEGWSRDTVSFTARYREGGDEVTERLVLRAENELQHDIDDESLPGNDIRTEYETVAAAQDAPVPGPAGSLVRRDRRAVRTRPLRHGSPRGGAADHVGIRATGRTCTTRGTRTTDALPNRFVDAAAGVHSIDGAADSGDRRRPARRGP
ncbi:hypothetical protein [Natrinema saccharevitans]|uniref:hypothetical protein n=1 Tax=Natrinema saccharevitans TaxID=301967 RepID=UPI001FEC7C3B|nr:hypothetical protein [Natrinema saccharevitans]